MYRVIMKHLEVLLNGPHSYTRKVLINVQCIIGMFIWVHFSVVYYKLVGAKMFEYH